MKTIISLFLLIVISVTSFAIPVKVKFRVVDENGDAIKGATIRVYDNNKLIGIKEDVPAKVVWKLQSDSYYTIEIALDKYVSKRLGIYTKVAEDVEEILDNRFVFFVELEHQSKYTKYKNSDEVTDYPSAIVEFNIHEGVFDYNEKYWISTRLHYRQLRNSISTPEF